MLILGFFETAVSFITVDRRDGSGGKSSESASGAMHAMFLFLIIWILCARQDFSIQTDRLDAAPTLWCSQQVTLVDAWNFAQIIELQHNRMWRGLPTICILSFFLTDTSFY